LRRRSTRRRRTARSSTSTDDPLIHEFRRQISARDREILVAVNERLELVSRLWRHKQSQGIDVIDRGREQSLLDELARANRGPLSEEGVRELFSEILALVHRELERRA
jgi:chorismate mutase